MKPSRIPAPVGTFRVSRFVLLVRLAALVAITSGLIGGIVWLGELEDRSDGDSLRWGHTHSAYMQFPPFNEPFLDLSLWILLACSAAAGVGGLMLLFPHKWGVPLVVWQARVSIITNGVIAFFIVVMMFVFANIQFEQWHLGGTAEALVLRLASIAVDLMLWTFLGSNAVREFFSRQSHLPGRAFEVIMKDTRRSSCPPTRPPAAWPSR